MDASRERGTEEHERTQAPAVAASTSPTVAVDARLELASTIGNRAYGTAVARRGAAQVHNGGAPGSAETATDAPLDAAEATADEPAVASGPAPGGSMPMAALFREALERRARGGGGRSVARDPKGADAPPAPATWTSQGRMASNHYQAHSLLLEIHVEAYELREAGFADFGIVVDEARSWMDNFSASLSAPLTADEARQLAQFGAEFEGKRDPALKQIAAAVVQQLSKWAAPPITDKDLFDIREGIHHEFVRSHEKDVLTQMSDLLGKAEEMVGEVSKWSERAADVEKKVSQAKRLQDINKGIKGISDKVGEAKKLAELGRDIGRLTGAIGDTPGGKDDIGALEGALNVIDFAISKVEIPGLKQLWDGYIFKLAKICVAQLRQLKELLYKADRPAVEFFFTEHINDPQAPKIDQAIVHGVDTGQHFPYGQPMLDFMWQVMRNPDSIKAVPSGIEDFFVKWRDEMNAGVAGEELESDDSISNLWNVFSRERAPNIVPWLKRNREQVWIKLYGGMPHPR